MKVLVLDGDNRAALAITRSLGRGGHEVIVGEQRRPSLAGSSKYCREALCYPPPAVEEQAFLDFLVEAVREQGIEVLLPVSDVTTMIVAMNRERFDPGCRTPLADYETLRAAADKVHVFRLARELGIGTPRTVILDEAAGEGEAAGELDFPVVLKPRFSRVREGRSWHYTSVVYASDRDEFAARVREKRKSEFPLLIQERVRGPGVGAFFGYHGGKPFAFFCHRRLREKPPSGGQSVLRESIAPDGELRRLSALLLDSLKWEGVAMIEYKADSRDGSFKLMEINGRFWGSLQLAVDAGVDFPGLLMRALEGEEVPCGDDYQVGVKTRWLWGDIDALLMVLLKRRGKLKLPEGHRGRLAYLKEFLGGGGVNSGAKFEVLSRDDMGPWRYETAQRLPWSGGSR